jgi:hypothetical protein
MEYNTVEAILAQHGITNEPAFNDLVVNIGQMPLYNGRCPLGLYNQFDTAIQRPLISLPADLPPDIMETITLHEFGHRHGDYYYNDMTESYAEKYRAKYQKESVRIYEGPDALMVSRLGDVFEEGQRGTIDMMVDRPINSQDIDVFNEQMVRYSEGEAIPQVSYYPEQGTLRVAFTKGVNWPAIIGATLTAGVVIPFGVIIFAVYKMNTENSWVLPVVVVGVVSFFLLKSAIKHGWLSGGYNGRKPYEIAA